MDPNASLRESGGSTRSASQAAYLFAATCPGLARWSERLRFEVRHIGIASDPLEQIGRLRALGYAASRCGPDGFMEDADLGDWALAPLDLPSRRGSLPAGCSACGGAVRVALPEGATAVDLQQRYARFMTPLEATACAHLPSALDRRRDAGEAMAAMPRYMAEAGAHLVVQDLYRVDGPEDVEFAIDALEAALAALGPDRDAFDRAFALLASPPGAVERGWGTDLPPA